MGERWGAPIETVAGVLGDPWKTRVPDLSERKEKTQSTMYEGAYDVGALT